jgi:hypothetical protein
MTPIRPMKSLCDIFGRITEKTTCGCTIGLGETGEETAPLGRAVVGGLAAATFVTLAVLPAIFSLVRAKAGRTSPSLDPDDPVTLVSESESM